MDEYGVRISCAPRYSVTKDGKVFSHVYRKVREMKVSANSTGYNRVGLFVNGKYVRKFIHRLVLEAFVGPEQEGMVARHKNGVRTDNRSENLEWGTYVENEADKLKHGTRARGERQGSSRLAEEQVLEIRERYDSGEVGKEIARDFGVTPTMVSYIGLRKNWKWLGERYNVTEEGYTN